MKAGKILAIAMLAMFTLGAVNADAKPTPESKKEQKKHHKHSKNTKKHHKQTKSKS